MITTFFLAWTAVNVAVFVIHTIKVIQ